MFFSLLFRIKHVQPVKHTSAFSQMYFITGQAISLTMQLTLAAEFKMSATKQENSWHFKCLRVSNGTSKIRLTEL